MRRKSSMNIYRIEPADNKMLVADWPWGRGRDAKHEQPDVMEVM